MLFALWQMRSRNRSTRNVVDLFATRTSLVYDVTDTETAERKMAVFSLTVMCHYDVFATFQSSISNKADDKSFESLLSVCF